MTIASIAAAKARLADLEQAVRDAAAAELREAIVKDPDAAGDHGEAFWRDRITAIPPNVTVEEFRRLTGATFETGVSSGQTGVAIHRLDDYWIVVVELDASDKVLGLGAPERMARRVWVDPPAGLSGRWVTYFVNGAVAYDVDYVHGSYRRFTAYHDNGRVWDEQHYVDGAIDGVEVGFHRNGTKAYEGRHVAGKRSSRWTHWYANGRLQSEETWQDGLLDGSSIQWREDGTKSSRIDYRAGVETGQAAWDETGALLYARGSAR